MELEAEVWELRGEVLACLMGAGLDVAELLAVFMTLSLAMHFPTRACRPIPAITHAHPELESPWLPWQSSTTFPPPAELPSPLSPPDSRSCRARRKARRRLPPASRAHRHAALQQLDTVRQLYLLMLVLLVSLIPIMHPSLVSARDRPSASGCKPCAARAFPAAKPCL